MQNGKDFPWKTKNRTIVWPRNSTMGHMSCCRCSVAQRVWLSVTPWTAAHQAPLSFTTSWSFLKLTSIELVISYPEKKKKIQKAPVWFLFTWKLSLVCSSKFSYSVAQSCPTLQPHDCNMPGFPVHHQLQEFTQTHAHWVGDAIQPSHPLSSPAPPAFILSQHQGLFQWVSSPHQVAKVLEFQLQHQSFQWIFRTDFL